jgi:hypothetical protein
MKPRKYTEADIGKIEDGWTNLALHKESGGMIKTRHIEVKDINAVVKASEFTILAGAMAAPICDLYVRIAIDLEDLWNDEVDVVSEVNLLHLEDGVVVEFMSYQPNETGEGFMGLGASDHFRDDQEARLKFLIKFDMNGSEFDELNPPWEY